MKSNGNGQPKDLREPIFGAMDQLRTSLDLAIQDENDQVAGLLLIALQDLADIVDATNEGASSDQSLIWTVSLKQES